MKTIFILLISVFCYFSSAYACDCKTTPNPLNEKTLQSGAYEFFVGTVEKEEKIKDGKITYYEFTFKVTKKYSLKEYVEVIKIRTRNNNCKQEFVKGETYLISVTRDKDKIRWTDICQFKRELKKAKRYMDFLDTKYKS